MSDNSRPLRVAIVGAGPAGIYCADALMKSDTASERGVSIDLYERMPAPFGLIRYGVAPDHPRIKGIITALHKVLDKPQVRLLGNIDYGTDITLADLRKHYDAVVFSTGATDDRALQIPGVDLERSYGAGEFVAWYDGHPDFSREWPLEEEKVAVIGVGNVALDVARVLAKTGDELLPTEIPDNVYQGLKANKAVEVHVFGRRGPAQAKFTPLELKELDHSPNIEVIVDPEDIEYDEGSAVARRSSKITDQVATIIENYAIREPKQGAIHKLFLHFFENPTEILGEDGKVVGLRTERTELDGTGNVKGTGKTRDWDVTAVYRAVGYLSDNLPEIPFDDQAGVIPNEAGRIFDDGKHLTGLYTTGWIKRGPVGLIGHTKGDANETVECILEDMRNGVLNEVEDASEASVVDLLESRGIPFTTWDGWYRLDEHERKLGEAQGRDRVKVVEREDMLAASEPHKVNRG
ncbi:FAD-dependent oxidoreductase [Gordonia sp. PS3]|uniref:ferredoxin--NADP(+) reductase n=1 Tax=Gordonia sihwensis NBRC 108236 TaxID=1223544 RepID=L7LIP4_9ACTN|nr:MULTISPECIES: FAD-dependent oxidoreductase [Gordonia]AUH67927.1 pyridine nucleotide-disulfide oxidoreductase [Gordonia sp. YC-JH1]KJR07956.1 pyridine nucleotide-disulfide oxidoreductase [Gordonia sihwensis]KXT58666.1 pyridine nucleotide-disulfide oxidoreductase [Gordonia sp. QH-12]MBY4571417.1 pyridine nucleotide-disulfide oxidoreductase [Gordonia sihwensis]GAC60759.1 putative ferredoxin--NADP(+) reductase [Gordonia sihwensis NBRC 108236]